MITTEMVIGFLIGVMIVVIYKLVKFNRECRRRIENLEKSNEISKLLLDVLDYPQNGDYKLFVKQARMHKKMMEIPTSGWKLLTYMQKRKIIDAISDEYDRNNPDK